MINIRLDFYGWKSISKNLLPIKGVSPVSPKPPPLYVVVRVEVYDSHEDELFIHDLA